jgi:hypothetical protein
VVDFSVVAGKGEKMFYIGFVTASRMDAQGEPYAEGELTAGRHSERFRADLRVWRKADYENQWKEGVARLLSGAKSSALVTSLCQSGEETSVELVPLSRRGGTVSIGERAVLTEALPEPLDVGIAYELVAEREAETRSARPQAEVPLGQLATFTIDV